MTRLQFLTFSIAGDQYAVGILKVREIVALDTVTKIPRTPAFIRGVMNLRGTVVPVVDLAVKLGLPPIAPAVTTCVVIVDADLSGETATIGLLTDSVNDVLDLEPGQQQSPPSFGTRLDLEFLTGIANVGGSFVPILDVDKVLLDLERLTAVHE